MSNDDHDDISALASTLSVSTDAPVIADGGGEDGGAPTSKKSAPAMIVLPRKHKDDDTTDIPPRIPTQKEWSKIQASANIQPWYALAEWESLGSRILWCHVHSPRGDHKKFVLYSSGRIIFRMKSLQELSWGQFYTVTMDPDAFMSPLVTSGLLDNFVTLDKGYSLPSNRTCHSSTIIGASYQGRDHRVSVYNYHRGLASYFWGPGRHFHRVLDVMFNFDDADAVPLGKDELVEVSGYFVSPKWQANREHGVTISKQLIQYYGTVLGAMKEQHQREGGDTYVHLQT